jgi:hypothetical protein
VLGKYPSSNEVTYKLTHETLQVLNSKSAASDVFCDLAKSFNCANESTSMTKLANYSLNGNYHK